jgi:hypothetical protein
MAFAEFNHEDFEQSRQAEQDEKLLVKFFQKAMQDTAKSAEQGRPVFKDVEYIDIQVPGQRGSGVKRKASYRDKQRFPKHYAAFQQRVELPQEGTPLAEWGMITRSLAEELSFQNIKTVEHLANLSDSIASGFMGGYTLKGKANAWLDRAKADVTLEHLEGELAKRDAQIAELSAKLDALVTESKPKRKTRAVKEVQSDDELSDIGQRSAEQGSG